MSISKDVWALACLFAERAGIDPNKPMKVIYRKPGSGEPPVVCEWEAFIPDAEQAVDTLNSVALRIVPITPTDSDIERVAREMFEAGVEGLSQRPRWGDVTQRLYRSMARAAWSAVVGTTGETNEDNE